MEVLCRKPKRRRRKKEVIALTVKFRVKKKQQQLIRVITSQIQLKCLLTNMHSKNQPNNSKPGRTDKTNNNNITHQIKSTDELI